jgi:arginyl-tRNA synthetase
MGTITIREELQQRLQAALNSLGFGSHQAVVAPAADPRFGDYQSNAAMLLAKQQRTNPRALAQQIAQAIDTTGISAPVEIAGAGFLNFRLLDSALVARAEDIYQDERLGTPQPGQGKKVVIDFSSPNLAKPMHVGHIRTTVLGEALARIARFLGWTVIADNHVGDWGTQFGKVIYGWKNCLDTQAFEKDPINELVRLYKEANSRAEADPEVLAQCRQELVRLQQGDPENRAIWERCVEVSRAELEQMYELLDIHFDVWLGESFYHDQLGPLVDRLLASGIAEISEGAACIFFRDNERLADKPCLIRKSDGGFLYATTDLATVEYRVKEWNPDEMWYVTGAPQQLHLEQVFEASKRMGITARLVHIPFGSILGEDRKLMKTRSGETVGLREVLEEGIQRVRKIVEEKNPDMDPGEREQIARQIGIGAVKYAELSQFRMTDYVFSWEKMLSMQGNTAPYLQNAYVRIQSIFRKGGVESDPPAGPIPVGTPEERTLVLQLLRYGETLPQVLEDFRPNVLAHYLYELASAFHGFFEACPVLKAPEGEKEARLRLCTLTSRVLRHGLNLLGIEVPSRM